MLRLAFKGNSLARRKARGPKTAAQKAASARNLFKARAARAVSAHNRASDAYLQSFTKLGEGHAKTRAAKAKSVHAFNNAMISLSAVKNAKHPKLPTGTKVR